MEYGYHAGAHLLVDRWEWERVRGFSLPLSGLGLFVADSPAVCHELQRWLLPIRSHLLVGHVAAHGHLMARNSTARPTGMACVGHPSPAYSDRTVRP